MNAKPTEALQDIQIQEEIWKDIKGYEGRYQVSNMGRVKSLDRTASIKTALSELFENEF